MIDRAVGARARRMIQYESYYRHDRWIGNVHFVLLCHNNHCSIRTAQSRISRYRVLRNLFTVQKTVTR